MQNYVVFEAVYTKNIILFLSSFSGVLATMCGTGVNGATVPRSAYIIKESVSV